MNVPACPRVTAAVIAKGDCLFIAQRAAHKSFGLYWEFPGGKAEDGEGLEESLVREIREELCWDIRVGELLCHVPCRGRDLRIDLFAFWCTIEKGELSLREHVACRWVPAGELRGYRFTEADRRLIPLIEGAMLPPGGASPASPVDGPCS